MTRSKPMAKPKMMAKSKPAAKNESGLPELGCCGVLESDLSEDQARELAESFAALGDPVRVQLLSLIHADSSGEACICDLVEPTGKSQPTISHHMKILREAGFVTSEKRGTWVWYRLVPDKLEQLSQALSRDLSQR